MKQKTNGIKERGATSSIEKGKKIIKGAIILEIKPGPFDCIKRDPSGMTVYVNFKMGPWALSCQSATMKH